MEGRASRHRRIRWLTKPSEPKTISAKEKTCIATSRKHNGGMGCAPFLGPPEKRDRCTIESQVPSRVMTAAVGDNPGAHSGPSPQVRAREAGTPAPVRGCRGDGSAR